MNALSTTHEMRRCIAAGVLSVVERIPVTTTAIELQIAETTVRRRIETQRGSAWSVDDLAWMLAYERDELRTTRLLRAITEADGRATPAGDAMAVEGTMRRLGRSMAGELTAMLRRVEDDGVYDRQESLATAEELGQLITLASAAISHLRARAAGGGR